MLNININRPDVGLACREKVSTPSLVTSLKFFLTSNMCWEAYDAPQTQVLDGSSVRENVVSHSKKRKKSCFFGF